MTEEAQEMYSIPPRLGLLEQEVHTLKSDMDAMKQERLPHRVGNLEASIQDLNVIRQDTTQMKVVLAKMNSFVRGAVWILGGLVALATLLIALAGVMPKMDAIIIEKSPPVQVDE
jgi:hypothetical protein